MNRLQVLIILIIFSFSNCSRDPVQQSPYNSNLDPGDWMPKNLQLRQQNIHTINLTWDQTVDQIEGFKIDKKVGDNGWKEIKVLGKETMEYTDTAAVPGIENSYRVYAYAGGNNSRYLMGNIKIEFPAITGFNLKQNSIPEVSLSWEDNSSGEDGFFIDKKAGDGNWQIKYAELPENKESYIDTNAIPDEINYYRVYPFKADQKAAKIEKNIGVQFASPAGVNAEKLSVSRIRLTWEDRCRGEDGYRVDKKTEADKWTIAYGELDSNTTEYTDNRAMPENGNIYRIYAYKDALTSEKIKVSLNNVFEAPTNLKPDQNTISKVILEWKDNSSGEDGFFIDKKVGDGNWQIKYAELPENKESYTDTSVIPGETNCYRVYAFKNNRESAPIQKRINISFPGPTRPRLEQNSDVKLTLSWTDNCQGEEGYKIDRKTGLNSWQKEYKLLPANITKWSDHSPAYGVNNSYRVYAYKDEYNSSSISVNCKNIIQPPNNLKARTIDDRSIKFVWADNCQFEDCYKIERKQVDGQFSEIAELPPNTTEYNDIGLSRNVKYVYRIRACTPQNYSDYKDTKPILMWHNENFVYVKGGRYTMGDVWGDGKPNERPIHKVTVNSFYMSKYEITHGEYIEFLNSIDISPEGSFKGNELIDIDNSDCAISYNGTSFYFEGSSYADNEQCPVILVSWYGACEYCNWMSEQEGLTKAYIINKESVECNWDASGYRLPTEAEWEYTARSKGRNDRKWSGTNSELELSDYCWYDPDNGNKTHKVGTKKPNDIGIYDLSGNVYEWCWDWHGDYSSSSQNNPKGPASGSYRVLRGGHWYYFAFYLRTSYRHLYSPSFSMVSIGFRIVRSG